MLRPILAINIALLTEGAGMEWPKLETSMNRGVNENAALKSRIRFRITIPPPIRLSGPEPRLC